MFEENYAISKSHLKFIKDIDRRFLERNIAEKFDFYLSHKAEDRISLALTDRQKLLRAGWHKRGIPKEDTETVDEHVFDMKEIAKANLEENVLIVVDMIEAHDTPEVIASDFIPSEPIEPSEKRLIEMLAARVIYQAQPQMVKHWSDYEDQTTYEAKIVKDLDKGQMYIRANMYHVTHPHIDLSEFSVDRQNYKWRTPEGRKIGAAYSLL